MKRLLCIVLCLLLAGCASEAAEETRPLEGSLQAYYYNEGTVLVCNGEALTVGSVPEETLEALGIEELSGVILTENAQVTTSAPVYAPEGSEESLWLDCARVRLIPTASEPTQSVLVEFGEVRLLFLGAADIPVQDETLRADIVQLPEGLKISEALSARLEAGFAVITGNENPGLAGLKCLAFTTGKDGPIIAETQGGSVEISWNLQVSDSVASGI